MEFCGARASDDAPSGESSRAREYESDHRKKIRPGLVLVFLNVSFSVAR